MENSYKYDIAGHLVEIVLPEGYSEDAVLAPYIPFAAGDNTSDPLFRLKVVLTDGLHSAGDGKVVEIFNDEAPYFWIIEDASHQEGMYHWCFGFSYTKLHPDCIVRTSADFSDTVVYVPSAHADRLVEFALSNSAMLVYTFRTSPFDTLMVHASVVENGGVGYMFLGKSGTGKSTHTRLWLENIPDSVLLNDDNPVVRVMDGEVYVYGSPWSGKTPCYRNRRVRLKAVVRLSQAPYDRISSLVPLQAYASLMPACSCMRWDSASALCLHETVEKVIMRVPGWHLECLPDAEAALTSYSACSK